MLTQIFCKKIKRLKTIKIILAKAADCKTFKIAESAAGTTQNWLLGPIEFVKYI